MASILRLSPSCGERLSLTDRLFAVGELGERVGFACRAKQLVDNLGIEHRLARTDPAQCVEEVARFRDPIFELVTDTTTRSGGITWTSGF